MKKFATTATAAAVLLTGLAGASRSSDAAGPAAPEDREHVKRLVSQRIESHELDDRHPAGVDRLRSRATRRIVGYESFSGVVDPETGRLRFWLADALKGGVIVSYFNLDPETTGNTFTGRITRGTGRYSGIEGTIHVRNRADGRTVYTLRFTL